MSQIEKINKGETAIMDLREYPSLQVFAASLQAEPKMVAQEPMKKNSLHVPISEVQASLDEMFGAGMWSTENLKVMPFAASTEKAGQFYVSVSLTLAYHHPVSHIRVTREGVASGFVEHKTFPTQIQALSAAALKNAAKSIGNLFGRDLNRKDELTSTRSASEDAMEDLDLHSQLEMCQSQADVLDLQRSLPKEVSRNREIYAAINKRYKELKTINQPNP